MKKTPLQIEKNVSASFGYVKKDMLMLNDAFSNLQDKVQKLAKENETIKKELEELKTKKAPIKKTTAKKKAIKKATKKKAVYS